MTANDFRSKLNKCIVLGLSAKTRWSISISLFKTKKYKHVFCGLCTSIDISVISVSISVSRNLDRMAMARRTSSRLATGIESCCKWSSFLTLVSVIFFPNSSFRYLQSISLQDWVSTFRDLFSGSVYKRYSVTVQKDCLMIQLPSLTQCREL